MNDSMIRLYVGLPGSGKTFHANLECDVVVDDISSISELPNSISGTLGITDVNFCDAVILSKAKEMLSELYNNVKIEVIYFENSLDKCVNNVYHRNDGRDVMGTIKRFSKIYVPPKCNRKVWFNE